MGFEFADWTQKHHTSHNTWVDFLQDGLDTVASLNWTAVRALEAIEAPKRVEFRGGSNGNTPGPPNWLKKPKMLSKSKNAKTPYFTVFFKYGVGGMGSAPLNPPRCAASGAQPRRRVGTLLSEVSLLYTHCTITCTLTVPHPLYIYRCTASVRTRLYVAVLKAK